MLPTPVIAAATPAEVDDAAASDADAVLLIVILPDMLPDPSSTPSRLWRFVQVAMKPVVFLQLLPVVSLEPATKLTGAHFRTVSQNSRTGRHCGRQAYLV